MNKIGERLLSLRNRSGISSRAGVAERIGVSVNSIAYWENNERTPNPKDGAALAELYNVSLDFLYLGKEANSAYLAKSDFSLKNISGEEADELLQCLDAIKGQDLGLFESFWREFTAVGNKIIRMQIYKT